MRVVEGAPNATPLTRDQLTTGQVFRYLDGAAKPGLRMVTDNLSCEPNRLYSVRLSDGTLMVTSPGSNAASGWEVEVVDGAFVEGFES